MIKTVIFDIGNVLTSFGWEDFIRSFGFSEEISERIGRASILSSAWDEYDRGVLSTDEIINLFVENDPGIEDEIRCTQKCLTGILLKRDYAIPWIEELKSRGYQVLFLSNFSKRVFDECNDAIDFVSHMDGGVFSYEVKLIKPDIAIYNEIINKYDLIPEECVFIDDREENITAAWKVGLKGIVFSSYEQAKTELEKLL